MDDTTDRFEYTALRIAYGTYQIGTRRWKWIWESKEGRGKTGRALLLAGGLWSGYALGHQWPWFGGVEILALVARGYATADIAPPATAEPELVHEETERSPEELVLAQVVDIIGDALGIHLDVLLDRLREEPDCGEMTRDELRLVLHAVGCPIRKALRVGSRTGIAGVHRDDARHALQALDEDDTPLPPPDHSPDL